MPPQTTGEPPQTTWFKNQLESLYDQGERVVDMGRAERVGEKPLAAHNHYPGELNYEVRRRNAAKSPDPYFGANKIAERLAAEEMEFQAWHKERADRLGIHPDPYNRLHAYDLRGWWYRDRNERMEIENLRRGVEVDPDLYQGPLNEILKNREDREGGRHPDELPEEFEHMTPEYKQQVISRAKETFGKNWKPMRNIADLTMSDLREYERAVEKFNEAREGDRRARESARRRSNFPLRDKITTPGPKGSYFDFYKTNVEAKAAT